MSVLELRSVGVRFRVGGRDVPAVDQVDLSVGHGAVVGLVGESGSGKSTLARAIVGLAPLTTGEIFLDGEPIALVGRRADRAQRRRRRLVQMVFQDPYASLDPRMSIGSSIAEGVAAGRALAPDERPYDVGELLELVRLNPDLRDVRPGRLSGGQRQRVAIARALAARPKVLLADEITSALDVSVQGAVLNLMREVQRETGVSVLFISHNLAVVRYLSQDIAVMSGGRVVESGPSEQVTGRPATEYTRALVSAVPDIRSGTAARRT